MKSATPNCPAQGMSALRTGWRSCPKYRWWQPVSGPWPGLGALYMVQSHFSVMVQNMCHVFVGGPPLVKSAFGEEFTKEELGGYKLHTRLTGVIDNDAVDERDALDQIKRFLSYMPSNVWEMPKRQNADQDDPERREEDLINIIPRDNRKPYDMRRLLNLVLDRDSIFEIGKYQGRPQITALARLNGYPVGVLSNDPIFWGGPST